MPDDQPTYGAWLSAYCATENRLRLEQYLSMQQRLKEFRYVGLDVRMQQPLSMLNDKAKAERMSHNATDIKKFIMGEV